MRVKVQAAALAAVLLVAPAAFSQTDPDTIPEAALAEMIRTGSDLFNGGSCVLCHAVGGRGAGRRAPDLSDAEWLHSMGNFDGIFTTIFWGVPKEKIKALTPRPFEMHPRGGMNIDRNQIQALAAYVWSLSQPGKSPVVDEQARFLELASQGRLKDAVEAFRKARQSDAAGLLFPERALNSLGYVYLNQRKQPEVALELFKLNVQTHPGAWNTYDSLGEAHMVLGETQLAIRNYEKSLELNPENTNAEEKLRELRGT